MSEPVKKINSTPESYSPKNKPVILKMVSEASVENSKIEEANPLTCESFEYIKLGQVRFIGIDASRTDEEWDALWERSGEYMPALDALAEEYGADITEACSMMHHNGNEVDSENHFLAGRFFKGDTPVPEGYDSYDVPTENAAYAVYSTEKYDGPLGAVYYAARDKILADGVGIPYPHAYWHAEVYTNGRPHEGNYRFGYMFSVDEKAEDLIAEK